MSPQVKKFLSSLGVAVGGAVLVALNAEVVHLPAIYQGLAGAALAAAAHFINAWGTSEQVLDKAISQVSAK